MSRSANQLTIEYALLGFLEARPLHGYELHQRLQEAKALGLIWHVKQSQLYALITKLEASGLIEAERVEQPQRHAKRLLHLTAAGQGAFNLWRTQPVVHGRDIRIEFLGKLFWAQQHSPAAVVALLTAQRAAIEALLAKLCAEQPTANQSHLYPTLVYTFRRGQLEAVLDWLAHCETLLLAQPA